MTTELHDVVRWMGVLLAFEGAALTAMDTTLRLFDWLGGVLVDGWKLLWSALVSIIPGLSHPRRHALAIGGSILGHASVSGKATVHPAPWPDNGTLDEKVEHLRHRLQALDDALARLRSHVTWMEDELRALIDEMRQDLEERIDAVQQEQRAERSRGMRLDAHGVPITLAAIVLTAVPDVIAALPLRLGWQVVPGTIAVTAWALHVLIAEDLRSVS